VADDGDRMGWAAVVLWAVVAGVVVFVLLTLVNRYVFGEEFSSDATDPALAVTLVWITVGAAQRQGWMRYPDEPRKKGRRPDGPR
jgi:tellurite resistance protein TehA-like permease